MDIKEEDPLSDNMDSQSETVNSDAIKTEIKSETPPRYFPKEIKFETATCSSNWEIDRETEIEEQTLISDFGSQNEGELFAENPVTKLEKLNTQDEIENKIEIKVEPWWLETETSSACDEIKDGDLTSLKCSRLFIEPVSDASSDKPPLPSVEVPGRETDFYNRKDHIECEYQKSNVIEMPTGEEHVLSEQSVKHSEGGEMYITSLHLKQKCGIQRDKRPHKCGICDKSFTQSADLKRHNLIHEGKKPHQCNTCGKSFSQLSHLKRHNLIHEGKRPHQCKTCGKSFTRLSHLNTHNLIHEGVKPHLCKTCGKSFSVMSHLKTHNMIHEGKKPHQCKTCDRSFTVIGDLKRHNLIHEGKKPHQCKSCDKSFAQFSNLKRHNLIHEGNNPHECKTCNASFIRLGDLRRHNLIHEGNKPHQCTNCDKSFTRLEHLRRHNMIH